jgi:hypothetical protein
MILLFHWKRRATLAAEPSDRDLGEESVAERRPIAERECTNPHMYGFLS